MFTKSSVVGLLKKIPNITKKSCWAWNPGEGILQKVNLPNKISRVTGQTCCTGVGTGGKKK